MLSNRHRAGYSSFYLLNMLHFDMQNLYFLDNPHPVSTDKLGYDFSFPLLHFGYIYYHILVSYTMFHLTVILW